MKTGKEEEEEGETHAEGEEENLAESGERGGWHIDEGKDGEM